MRSSPEPRGVHKFRHVPGSPDLQEDRVCAPYARESGALSSFLAHDRELTLVAPTSHHPSSRATSEMRGLEGANERHPADRCGSRDHPCCPCSSRRRRRGGAREVHVIASRKRQAGPRARRRRVLRRRRTCRRTQPTRGGPPRALFAAGSHDRCGLASDRSQPVVVKSAVTVTL
jgi:hypothetical protein